MMFLRSCERCHILAAFSTFLFWGALLLLTTVLGANAERYKPLPHQIELVKNEYDAVLWDCSDSGCPYGTGLSVKCGTSVPYNTSIVCEICEPRKTYSDTHNFDTCKPCLVCKENQVWVSGECTLKQDSTKCECKHGYYDDGNGDCKMCSICCGDDRNLRVADCDEMPLNQRCGVEQAGNCAPTTEHVPGAVRCTTSAESANKLTYAVIGLGSTAGMLLVFFFFLFLWCKCPRFKQKVKGTCLGHSSDASGATSEHASNGMIRSAIDFLSRCIRGESDCDSTSSRGCLCPRRYSATEGITPSKYDPLHIMIVDDNTPSVSRRLSQLSESPDVFDEVCARLDEKHKGYGNYHEVLLHFGKKFWEIRSKFEKHGDSPSAALFEWLAAMKPELTVKEFSDVLLKKNIKRKDVVMRLKEFDLSGK